MVSKALEALEKRSFEENDSSEIPPDDIVAFNELRSCADLYRMYKQGILNINPDFQRDFVWKDYEQTRFIDSLTKQLPIPSMCFAVDHKLQKWMVIDGLQRMSSIVKFLEGGDWQLSKLQDIDPAIAGKNVSEIKDEKSPLHKYYLRIENLSIPVTMLRCDFQKKSHQEYLFTIFHRLNTGGVKLNNQEIRNGIFSGKLNILLKSLDQKNNWRSMNKMEKGKNYRFTKQELILRFFAFLDDLQQYDGKLAVWLNNYMRNNRNPTDEWLSAKENTFDRTVEIIYSKIFSKRPPTLSLTLIEAMLVGVAENLAHLEESSPDHTRDLFLKLINEPEFNESSLLEGLAQKKKVTDRINKAKTIFSE
jgi:hypothetical protein